MCSSTRGAGRGCASSRAACSRPPNQSVRALDARIDRYIREWDERATPFVWVKAAAEILAKAVRKPQDHSGTDH